MKNIEITMVDLPVNMKIYDKKSNSFIIDIGYEVEFKIDVVEYVAKLKASDDEIIACYRRNRGSRETPIIISEETQSILVEKIAEFNKIVETI